MAFRSQRRDRAAPASSAAPRRTVTSATAPTLLSSPRVPASVLVIADRKEIASLIARCVAGIGHRPIIAHDVRHAALLLEREPADAVVLDLATPGHSESVVQWLRRDPARAGMAIVRVSARTRQAAAPRAEIATEVHVPKPFTTRQIADAVRTVLLRRTARQRMTARAGLAAAI
jgi:DNA-binding response OmpR family regulator